jgi:hypothetical protein|tara:strand:+ start:111 stop:248 length:138 start_codon:yes stop_codon:yes gene_type:complete
VGELRVGERRGEQRGRESKRLEAEHRDVLVRDEERVATGNGGFLR